jgi:hypothetical protein
VLINLLLACDSVDPPIDCCPLRWKTVAEVSRYPYELPESLEGTFSEYKGH